jgi:hypothetical protein
MPTAAILNCENNRGDLQRPSQKNGDSQNITKPVGASKNLTSGGAFRQK